MGRLIQAVTLQEKDPVYQSDLDHWRLAGYQSAHQVALEELGGPPMERLIHSGITGE